jgi:hypothetical protein
MIIEVTLIKLFDLSSVTPLPIFRIGKHFEDVASLIDKGDLYYMTLVIKTLDYLIEAFYFLCQSNKLMTGEGRYTS